jgi:hypothetical protein
MVATRIFSPKVAESLSANYSQSPLVKNLRKSALSGKLLAGVDNGRNVSSQ